MADEPTLMQIIGREIVDFVDWFRGAVADPQLRAAMLRDVGIAAPTGGGAPLVLPPADGIDGVNAWLDAPDPSLAETLQAVHDIAALIDQVVEVLGPLVAGQTPSDDDVTHALLELGATNWFRQRWPRWFVVLQAVSLIDDLTTTYGPGNNNPTSLGTSIAALAGYIWQPGTSIEELAGPSAAPGTAERVVDLIVRLAAVTLGFLDKDNAIESLHDLLTGWDAPELGPDSVNPPSRADVVSARMTSISGSPGGGAVAGGAIEGTVQLTVATIHEAEGGPGLFVAVGGNADFEKKLGDWWTFSAKARADAAVALLWRPAGLDMASPAGGNYEFGVGYRAHPPEVPSVPDAPSTRGFPIKLTGSTRIDIGEFAVGLTLKDDAVELLVRITESALVLDAKDQDGFLGHLLGEGPLRLPFGLELGPSSKRGMVARYVPPREGGTQSAGVPVSGAGSTGVPVHDILLPLGKSLGPLTIHDLGFRMARGPAELPPSQQTRTSFGVSASFSARIGPVHVRVDGLAVEATMDEAVPPAERNLRVVDLTFDTGFPRGIAVNVETDLVAGGGAIFHDPDVGTYFGVFDVAFRGGLTAQAVCLVATRQADGSKGFSMVALLTVELASPWPLGMGFHLDGFGGLLALHRTFDETAVRAALPTGQLRNVLFPADPVHHSAEILHALQGMFPAQRDSHIAGVLVKIGWAAPTLVSFELGVLYQWGRQHRLIILGRVSAVLPRTDLPILKLNMDAVGILDFDAGTFALDAVLYDSRLCDRFVLTGAMAMRMGWKDTGPGFALAVGGLHPKFAAPAGFPSVARLQLALTNGENPKLVCQAYFAITSNTVQFGASCSLYAAAFGFSITGDVGFDVLIQLLPFHFLAEFRASVQLKRGSHNLFKVSVSGALEGPLPLRISGKASFEILWCDFSVPVNATLVSGGTPNDLVLVDVLAVLVEALSAPRAWQAQLPPGSDAMVSLRQPVTDGVLLHPLGTLTVRQTVVPLGLDRDIDRVGTATPSGERRFAVTHAALGTHEQERDTVRELFAPGQFFDLSDDDRLAAPSFESMGAGVTFGHGGYTMGPPQASPFDYTDITIGLDGEPVLEPEPHHQVLVLDLMLLSPAARAATRRTLTQRFAAPVSDAAPTLNPGGWAAVDGTAAPERMVTWVEAQAAARGIDAVVVPASELVG